MTLDTRPMGYILRATSGAVGVQEMKFFALGTLVLVAVVLAVMTVAGIGVRREAEVVPGEEPGPPRPVRSVDVPHKVTLEALDAPMRLQEQREPEVATEQGATIEFRVSIVPSWDVEAARLEFHLPPGATLTAAPSERLLGLKKNDKVSYNFAVQIAEATPDGRYPLIVFFVQETGGGSAGGVTLVVGNPPPPVHPQEQDGVLLLPAAPLNR